MILYPCQYVKIYARGRSAANATFHQPGRICLALPTTASCESPEAKITKRPTSALCQQRLPRGFDAQRASAISADIIAAQNQIMTSSTLWGLSAADAFSPWPPTS